MCIRLALGGVVHAASCMYGVLLVLAICLLSVLSSRCITHLPAMLAHARTCVTAACCPCCWCPCHCFAAYNKQDAQGKSWSDPQMYDAPLTQRGRQQVRLRLGCVSTGVRARVQIVTAQWECCAHSCRHIYELRHRRVKWWRRSLTAADIREVCDIHEYSVSCVSQVAIHALHSLI